MKLGSLDTTSIPSIDIILCATQRCGSTLIAEDMRNCQELGNPEEYFIPWKNPSTHNHWRQSYQSVCQKAKGANGVSSVKVMANQLTNIEACLATFFYPTSKVDFPCFASIFSSSKWVWLKREDVVAQAISRVIAQQTGINHATKNKNDEHFAGNLLRGYTKDYNEAAKYSFKAILSQVTSINIENLCWSRFFKNLATTPLVFVYEDVIQDHDLTHIDRLLSMVGRGCSPTKIPRKMVKLSNDINLEWTERFFDEIKNANFRVRPQMFR